MLGLGTIINTIGIVAGGIFGVLFRKVLKQRVQDTLRMAVGVAVLFIGISGALEGIIVVKDGVVSTQHLLLIVVCMALGGLVGELINIDGGFEKLGVWLQKKSGSTGDNKFVEGFVMTSFTVCIGAMAIVGAIEDGISCDYTILLTKTILDVITVSIMTASLGKGCVFSAIPVFVLQYSVTLLASLLVPVFTPEALTNLSVVGNVLIFCVGLNLVWGNKVRVANFLPAIVFAVIFAFLPLGL
ncbi:MAG: DUF554 domain-containing protein [Clostridia bacterium]|nr:DUF554 domain-containing protein [Clostridia bacterium]